MVRKDLVKERTVIGGVCTDFVCRCCFTKYGWSHQGWCGYADLEQPSCDYCRYYERESAVCMHPAKKRVRQNRTG